MSPQPAVLTEENISALAHRIWEEEGQPEGKAEDHWRMAKRQLEQLADDSDQDDSRKGGIV